MPHTHAGLLFEQRMFALYFGKLYIAGTLNPLACLVDISLDGKWKSLAAGWEVALYDLQRFHAH